MIDSPNRPLPGAGVELGTSDFFGGQLIACFTNEFGERELAFLYDEQAGYLTALSASSFFCASPSSIMTAFVGAGSRFCGSTAPWDTYESFEYNGFGLELIGTDGADQISTAAEGSAYYCAYSVVRNTGCGLGGGDQMKNMVFAFGGTGNDVLLATCPGTHLYGGDGHDHLTNAYNTWDNGTQISLFGEAGKDCLAPYALPVASFSCGSGSSDRLYANGVTRRPSNCESFSWDRACATSISTWWGW